MNKIALVALLMCSAAAAQEQPPVQFKTVRTVPVTPAEQERLCWLPPHYPPNTPAFMQCANKLPLRGTLENNK